MTSDPHYSNRISVLIFTYNSREYIIDCVNSILWCNEIVVIDLGSTDGTLECLRAYPVIIYHHKWIPIAEKAYQYGIEKCKFNWILILDPDERVPDRTSTYFQNFMNENIYDALSMPWHNYIFNRFFQHSGWFPDNHIRLIRKEYIIIPSRIHQGIQTSGKLLTLKPDSDIFIEHINYSTIEHFIEKTNRYTTLEADQLQDVNKNTLIRNTIRSPFQLFRQRFLESKGISDGLEGLVACSLLSFYKLLIGFKYIEKEHWMNELNKPKIIYRDVKLGVFEGVWDLFTGFGKDANMLEKILYWVIKKSIGLLVRVNTKLDDNLN